MSGHVAPAGSVSAFGGRRLPFDPAALAAWLAPFAVILYLALQGGGYDLVLRNQVGIAVWWIVLVGALAGVLPAARVSRPGWVGAALLAAFAGWTALSLGWTESHERTVAELSRVAGYLGLFVLALAALGRVAVRHAVNGVAAAIALVALLAVLSRLHPSWFPITDTERFSPGNRRLNYPLGYWNALAALMAVGMPLALHAAATARLVVVRALAAASLPVMALCAYLTVSRGAVGMVAVAIVVFFALAPERLYRLATIAVAALGSAILIEADPTTGLLVVVCGGVALLQVALSLAERHVGLPRALAPSRRGGAVVALVLVAAAAGVFAAAGGPGWASDRWQQFKSQPPLGTVSQASSFSRLGNVSGNGRYQYWQVAAQARNESPLQGTGPGTFEFVWLREGPRVDTQFVRDAHSLWMEVQAELGIVGLLLLGGFFLLVLGAGTWRALREPEPHRRLAFAAATAGVAAFAAAAALEWVWELPVLAAIVMVLAAVVLGGGPVRWVRLERAPWRSTPGRVALAVLAIPALIAIALPLAATSAVRDSREAARAGDGRAALSEARTAAAIDPSAATPSLQQALIYEEAGALPQAVALARKATRQEPANWRTWLTLSRIEAKSGRAAASVAALRKARSLNPHSALFSQ